MNDAMPTTYSYYKAYSFVKRPFNKKTTNYNRYFNKRVNTVKSTRVNTARPKAEVNTVKASASWVWKPKHEELDHVFKSNSASKTLTRYDYVDALGRYGRKEHFILPRGRISTAGYEPDLWIVVLRIGKLQGIGEFSGVGFISTQQMVINSPCLTDIKNWLFQCKRHLLASPKQTALGKDFSYPLMADSLPKTIWLSIHLVVYNEELAILGQTATGKESSNPFMAGSLPKTIHFCDSLPSDEDSFKLIKLMILCTNFLTMVRDLENLKTSHLLKKDFLQMSKRAEDDKEEFGYILLVFMELTVKKLDD
ncbi:hypothetical protein Tco_1136088 [Tanacetum coccineum]